MNKQKTINRQIVSWKFLFEAHKFTIKNNLRNTDWIVDLFPQEKSAEHMAKINTLNYVSVSGAFPSLSWKRYQKFINVYEAFHKYINFLSIAYFPRA